MKTKNKTTITIHPKGTGKVLKEDVPIKKPKK